MTLSVESSAIRLASGCTITEPLARLVAFCVEEHAFYDAIPDLAPGQVTPIDVAITVAVNSFVNTATKLRSVQRGLALACDPLLATTAPGARLDEPDGPSAAAALVDAAITVPGVLVPVATKVLHRKRPALVPMLDQVVLDYYLDSSGNAHLRSSTQDKRRAGTTARVVLAHLRHDLVVASDQLDLLCDALARVGYLLEPLRALDILLWTEIEPRGYYRRTSAAGAERP